jgi:hypothetical protein
MLLSLLSVIAVAFAAHGLPRAPMARVLPIAEDARAVALEEGAFAGETVTRSACVFAAWIVLESNGDPTVTGDRGTSFGVGQIKRSHLPIARVTFEALTTDRRESMRGAWRVMAHEVTRCGGLARGLGAYASGKCGGAPSKVRERLALARCAE